MRAQIPRIKLGSRRTVYVAGAGAFALAAALIVFIVWLNSRLSVERDRQAVAARVEIDERQLRAPSSDGMSLYLNASEARAVANFRGVQYLATSGGLIALGEVDSVRRRYTTLDGLPDNDLTTLAVFQDRLFVGTASAGLAAFDGVGFAGYRFVRPKAARVSVLLTTETELLIGTLDGGLFEYDGQRFSRRFNSTSGADFNRVTALLPVDSRLYIGTQDAGLYIWREGHIEHIDKNEGLPSPHVTALAPLPSIFSEKGQIAVATDFSIVALNETNEINTISNRPNVTSLALSEGHLWAGLFSGGIIDLAGGNAGKRDIVAKNRSTSSEAAGLPPSATATVTASRGRLWVLTRDGAFARDERATRPGFDLVAGSLVGERMLSEGSITTVAFDWSGRLWVGYFDRGIDLIAPDAAERLMHIEDDRVREINHLAFDRDSDRMLAATSRGLAVFSSDLKQTVLTRESDGLISDSVAHISFGAIDSPLLASTGSPPPLEKSRGRATLLATAGGLTGIIGGRSRSITAFHGLASNHLYTSTFVGSRLFVGSLAGLVELEGLRVIRTYKTSNSRLSHDWVTALAEAEGTLYVGTNGGGIDALLPTGEWINFADELGKIEVNQNAMHYDGERLYVGTSDRGLLVYDIRDRRWTRISAGLASQSVTAITTDDHYVYLGTSNGLVRIEKRVIG